MNNTPSSERLHIGIFGRRNAGKSSIINAITNQNIAIVSDIKGTTTDPVTKSMELLPIGPVLIIDTPGIDDTGKLGELRVKKAYQTLNKTDIALLIVDSTQGMQNDDYNILTKIKAKNIPYIIVMNKCDISKPNISDKNTICVSTISGYNIDALRNLIAKQIPLNQNPRKLVGDLVSPLDVVMLVVPIDESAPKGRLILPQQQTIRDLLESAAISVVVKDSELGSALKKITPSLVITDSQAFGYVSKIVPNNIPLTSFSILFARYKGELETVVKGVTMLDKLTDGDTILISEGCTHHKQCNDIGSVKLPTLIGKYTGKNINFEFTGGTEFPDNLIKYKMVIHCGGCMLNSHEMKYRLSCAKDVNMPFTNYGIAIAYMNGILKRSTRIFPDIYNLLN